MGNLAGWLGEFGVAGVADVAVMALLIYGFLVWLKRTKQAALAVRGVLLMTGLYLVARLFDLHLTAAVFQGFFAVILVALVVIFQQELRYLFERIAQWSLDRREELLRRGPRPAKETPVDLLVNVVRDLARDRIGALIVLRGKDPLAGRVTGGERLNGELSGAILKSVFDPHSAGHDGAVILEGGTIRQFGCRLPLSKNSSALRGLGTRHAAALGLSEGTDALCIVVSEERGVVSVARHGELREIDGPGLRQLCERFVGPTAVASGPGVAARLLRSNPREKLTAIGLATALWFVLVHEARIVQRTLRVPVQVVGPAGETIRSVRPSAVDVTFSGPRRAFHFVGAEDVEVKLRPVDPGQGVSTVPVGRGDLVYPAVLELEDVSPGEVSVRFDSVERVPGP